ncbi:GDYXXLXY domain-containing protein [Priestia aryabhattai]|uniref:GDYXXLXY domain-containing protein n=1 Tax=Priestia aryabhattai TaxID=412384 RepID=UPI00211C9E2A|nr:GDYXXLXY domain-containing protein [Priestia aryabhattai]MCQ9283637.1 GDYXXLXY domain-containing protein [Priestia aryabhattai]
MREKLVRLGYLLGLALVLSGILYFFASNWQGFDRYIKIALSVGLMLLFYGSAFVVRKLLPQQAFLSHWTLLAGALSFGLSIALLSQIYNTHAESYWLFLIWLVPVILFSFFTKYQPFYVLSFVLFQFTMAFFISPTGAVSQRGEHETLLLYAGMAFVNLIIFWIIKKKRRSSPVIMYAAFCLFHYIFLTVSLLDFTGSSSLRIGLIIFYLLFLLSSFFYFSKVKPQRSFLGISIVAFALFVIEQFFSFIFKHYAEWSLFLALGFVILFIGASVWFVKWLTANTSAQKTSLRVIKRIAVIGITAIASVIGSSSLGGLVTLITGTYPTNGMLVIGVLLIVACYLIKADIPTVKYTLLMMGVLISGGASFFVNDILFFIYLIALVALLVFTKHTPVRLLLFVLVQGLLLIKVPTAYYDTIKIDYVLLALFLLNAAVYAINVHHAFKKAALLLAFIFLLSLTELSEPSFLNIIYCTMFFVISTVFLFVTVRKEPKYDFMVGMIFWFVFLAMKYYDFVWDLFNKSLVLVILGLIFLFLSRKWDLSTPDQPQPSFLDRRRTAVWIIILVQLIMLGGIFTKNEVLLQNGKEIKLALQPIDPRSLLQGDYVELNYDIAHVTLPHVKDGEKVKLVLRPDKQGVYKYAKIYQADDDWNKPYTSKEKDVVITGSYHDWGIQYGIEHYFIPEGTGSKVESEARFATVRVGKNGDAIVTKVGK